MESRFGLKTFPPPAEIKPGFALDHQASAYQPRLETGAPGYRKRETVGQCWPYFLVYVDCFSFFNSLSKSRRQNFRLQIFKKIQAISY